MPSQSKFSRLMKRISEKTSLRDRYQEDVPQQQANFEGDVYRRFTPEPFPPPLPVSPQNMQIRSKRDFQVMNLPPTSDGMPAPSGYRSPSGYSGYRSPSDISSATTATTSDYTESPVQTPIHPFVPVRPAIREVHSPHGFQPPYHKAYSRETSPSPTPKIRNEHQTLPENIDPLSGALNAVKNLPPKPLKEKSKTRETLNNLETPSDVGGTSTQIMASAAQGGVSAAGKTKTVENDINGFLERVAVVMITLDEVAKLHPFIAVSILAFKAAISLETKRRANEQKTTVLYMEMADMMAVLCQLKDVKDVEEVAPNGMPLRARLQQLSETTANEIESCANVCDTYIKKRLIVKVLQAPVWEEKLAKYIAIFHKRRKDFEFALTIRIARDVGQANRMLEHVEKGTDELRTQMNEMYQLLRTLASPEHKKLAAVVEQKGGAAACQQDENILVELSHLEPKDEDGVRRSKSTVDNLTDELQVNPETDINNNMEVFKRKFEIQKRQIIQETERIVKREGDRIIGALTSGAHDKVIDPDIYKIWKEMRWPTSVKTRNFIMAFHDYYHEKSSTMRKSNTDPTTDAESASAVSKADEWALEFIDVGRLQPISEAFDDDGSGFVTVNEVNAFTTGRPLGWSLPQWIAYWAVGWNMTLRTYQEKIRQLIGKMFAVLPFIRAENQTYANEYIQKVYVTTATFYDAVPPCIINPRLQTYFQSYVDVEESRLKLNLESIHYDMDGSETLELVTGPGRIERFVLPLLYLLFQRHFEVFRIARTRILHEDELWDGADTVLWVMDAVKERMETLALIFRQQKLEPEQQFKSFAHGLFESCYDPKVMWSPSRIRSSNPPDFPYNEEFEDKSIKPGDVCNYPLDQELIDYAAYDLVPPRTFSSRNVSNLLKPVVGQWSGTAYDGAVSTTGQITFMFEPENPADTRSTAFKAAGRASRSNFTITGKCRCDSNGALWVSFTQRFPTRFPTMYWKGQVNARRGIIMGEVHFKDDKNENTSHNFILKRIPSDFMRFRPLPPAFEENKARALWQFATSTVVSMIRCRSMSWSSYFQPRRNTRKRFIELYIRQMQIGKPLSYEETYELEQIRQSLTVADGRMYHSLALHQLRLLTLHGSGSDSQNNGHASNPLSNVVACEHCSGQIGGTRVFCLDCTSDDTWDSVDLCDNPECLGAEIRRKHLPRPHRPTHDFVKVRRVVHLPYIGQLERNAKNALVKARNILGSPGKLGNLGAKGVPACILCHRLVDQPCWYCIQCGGHSFICNSCDSLGEAASKYFGYKGEHDYKLHDLVRCTERVEDDTGVTIEEKLNQIEQRLTDNERALDERLLGIEYLLQQLLNQRSH